ncbi:MAG: hypothetical protein H0U34_06680 [Sphingomonas sp.]|nr:hypothetical protein [Sphingomonas sp.]
MDDDGRPQLRTFERPRPPRDTARQRRIWLLVALGAAVLAGILLASSVWSGSWKPQEKEERAEVDERVIAPEKQCALQSTYDSLKRALFARAARARGGDEAAFAKLSDFSLLRLQSPVLRGVDEDLNRINCNGVAVLQLPPGVRVADGGSTLSSPLDYAVQPAADGTGNVVMLSNADAITGPLATIRRSGAATTDPLKPPNMDPVTSPDGSPVFGPAPAPSPAPAPPAPQPRQSEPEPRQTGSARPSFNCGSARTRGEVAVCNDSGLAALDRQMASQFNGALRRADPQQRGLLQSTRSGFLAFRDRCRSDRCIADTYRGRMREISDIMAGRWQGR